MAYKVVPFHPTVTDKGGAAQAAQELQEIIENTTGDGWKFVSLQSMTTTVRPTGCAAIGGKPIAANFQLVIFEK
ncbi:MAG: hypothetical protein V4480_01045 [Patescibacteria group bacterium]